MPAPLPQVTRTALFSAAAFVGAGFAVFLTALDRFV
jgi:hypothetical protein